MEQSIPPNLDKALRTAVVWPAYEGGDPNLSDVYTLAVAIERQLQLAIPKSLPPKLVGVAIVEAVDTEVLPEIPGRLPGILRVLPVDVLIARARALLTRLNGEGIQQGDQPQSCVVALYAWHGCLNMAKACRRTYVTDRGEVAYALEQREAAYRGILKHSADQLGQGNPWVQYGITLARTFERARRPDDFAAAIVDDWLPSTSPYFDD